MMISFGSVCSGVDAASVALNSLGFKALWFAENAKDPSLILSKHYPSVPNLGDIRDVAELIDTEKISCPQVLFAGTPCQAFSLAGNRNGLDDIRGSLTLAFVDIVKALDNKSTANKKTKTTIVWENVDGVLSDKTNAFGHLLAGILGEDKPKQPRDFSYKWTTWGQSGHFKNEHRTIAWRVLDAKYFGVPQQRKRVFVISTDTKYSSKNILGIDENLKLGCGNLYESYKGKEQAIEKDGHRFFLFRDFTDCLYSAYGTKWNGNAAADNGSLFVAQNDRLRRLSVLECERLMGFPDNYTLVQGVSDTSRYRMLGNSWAVRVIKWIGYRLIRELFLDYLWHIHADTLDIGNKTELKDILDVNCPEKFYVSSKGKEGILRRSETRARVINPKLKTFLN